MRGPRTVGALCAIESAGGGGMAFRGKVAWVTGASSGIGEALAYALSARGAAVILSGRHRGRLESAAARLGGPAFVLPFEATGFDALPAIAERAIGWREGVDLLLNNAGITQRSLALDTGFDVYRRLMEVDYFAPVRLTQLVLPHMVERRSGHLSVVSSMAGKVGGPLRTGYAAAKHACVGYFDALRSEIEVTYGIGVSVILPGHVATAVARNALTGDGGRNERADAMIDQGMTPERAAQIILDGIAAGKREIAVGNEAELEMLRLRATEPDLLFANMAAYGASLSAARSGG
ncbi:SDR family NAD(P)-dependent oxidoreductase [Sphingomonas canadensis]|uniref:SDR family NAD(P)-dependent oxidoreductase n=1 Tax=Sphingomonas canadensis TaxID=1219257 RepID=A0ABW3H2B5_9SPHN|nr:SDR family NAD(P)-dependent oxidoreductase [Sphingomonas canadensis]MCW3834459.1 SDR family NAD(P)-dependent oxidoreductase [Sphingomonas canadensis]